MAFTDIGASWPLPAATRLGHWAPQALGFSILASMALVLRPLPPGSLAALLAPAALVLLVLLCWPAMRQHDRRLCEHCMAGMPLNPSETAVRLRRRLAVTHLGQDRRLMVAYVLVLLASNALLVPSVPGVAGEALRVGWCAVQASMIYLLMCNWTHRRLQPWCGHCRGGGGGEERQDTPEPLPSGTRRG